MSDQFKITAKKIEGSLFGGVGNTIKNNFSSIQDIPDSELSEEKVVEILASLEDKIQSFPALTPATKDESILSIQQVKSEVQKDVLNKQLAARKLETFHKTISTVK
ncbi:hypothetical protein [Okeania sp.]|uniref:hypothetical protein n=1 Tax=Okeania sp. TaxID=3100323 RepID=UPI002B4B43CA|nr:hypothetical protein [Okeania sp.]MEB3342182.1 hypothetical protein [Okeania sp.]